MDEGFISLHRKLLKSPVFGDADCLKVWIWCLLRAGHKRTKILMNATVIELERGQFVTGRHSATKELKMSDSVFRRRIELLQNLGNIEVKTTNRFSVITVAKYEYYQDWRKKTTNRQPTDNQQKATNNNNNNNNNKGE